MFYLFIKQTNSLKVMQPFPSWSISPISSYIRKVKQKNGLKLTFLKAETSCCHFDLKKLTFSHPVTYILI